MDPKELEKLQESPALKRLVATRMIAEASGEVSIAATSTDYALGYKEGAIAALRRVLSHGTESADPIDMDALGELSDTDLVETGIDFQD